LSVIAYIEVLYGIKKKRSEKQLRDFSSFIRKNNIQIFPIDKKIADMFIELKITLEVKGKKLDDFDLLIASTALANKLTLVTGNEKHFKRIPGLMLLSSS
jgi:tRNA(fMet)-specific endonuclease VapC